MNRKVLLLIVGVQLLLVTAVFVSIQVRRVEALIPNIVSVNPRVVGSTTWVDVVVFHQASPPLSSTHYVSNVRLVINGSTVDLAQTPQNTETFTVSYSLGSNANSYSVSAATLCILHGYGTFSSSVTIPEFLAPVLFILLTAITIIATKKGLSQRENKGALS